MNAAGVIGMALFGALLMGVAQRVNEKTSHAEEVAWFFAAIVPFAMMCNQIMIWPWQQ
jgi:hypothetical protein